MPKLDILAGATSVSVGIFIQDSSSTTGAGLTGLVFNSSGLTCYAVVPGASAAAITLATLAAANSAYSSGGFKEIDATNMPGWYRFDIPNTNISTGRSVGIHFKGVTNMAPLPLEISLTAVNNQDGVRYGMTALPNAAAEAAGGLYTRGSGAGQLSQSANGELGVATLTKTLTTYTGNTVQTGDAFARLGAPVGASISADIAAVKAQVVTINADTDDIQARLPAALTGDGNIKADALRWNGLATVALPLVPTTAGRTLDVSAGGEAGIDWANIGSPTTAQNLSATNIDVDQVIASVSGAVASVTGDVGGDVVGEVGSIGVGGIGATAFAANAVAAAALAADAVTEIVTAIFARTFSAAYDGLSFDEAQKLMMAALLAKCSGMGTTTGTFRNLADSADAIVATIDANGNRTAVSRTP